MRAPGCKLARRASTSFFVAKRKDVDGRASPATTLSRHCEQPPKGARKQSRAACARDLDRFAALAMTDASLLRRTSRSTRGRHPGRSNESNCHERGKGRRSGRIKSL